MASLVIAEVTGTSPDWSIEVEDSSGVAAGDHILAAFEGAEEDDGGVYRVSDVPDSTHISVVDDLGPTIYGKLKYGPASSYTPTPNLGLSDIPHKAHFWGAAVRRDQAVIDAASALWGGSSRGAVEFDESHGDITPDDVGSYSTVVYTSGIVPILPVLRTSSPGPWNLTGATHLAFEDDVYGTTEGDITPYVSNIAAVQYYEIINFISWGLPPSGAGWSGVVYPIPPGYGVEAQATTPGIGQVRAITPITGPDANTVLGFPTSWQIATSKHVVKFPDLGAIGPNQWLLWITPAGSSEAMDLKQPDNSFLYPIVGGSVAKLLLFAWNGTAWQYNQ